MRIEHPIQPFYDADSRILILGSFPSVKSREQGFFYGHPQNRFWKVLAAGQQYPAGGADRCEGDPCTDRTDQDLCQWAQGRAALSELSGEADRDCGGVSAVDESGQCSVETAAACGGLENDPGVRQIFTFS